jgi:hypothetical protein
MRVQLRHLVAVSAATFSLCGDVKRCKCQRYRFDLAHQRVLLAGRKMDDLAQMRAAQETRISHGKRASFFDGARLQHEVAHQDGIGGKPGGQSVKALVVAMLLASRGSRRARHERDGDFVLP